MKIGILGTGMVGQALGAGLTGIGETVVFGTRDVSETLARTEPDSLGNPPFSSWIGAHPDVCIGSFSDAAAASELLINATAGSASIAALESAGEPFLRRKILIDVANPLDFSNGFPPSLTVCNTESLAEQIQRRFPETHVVKTLNTLNAALMTHPEKLGTRHHIFVSGDHANARSQVAGWLSSWFGWKPGQILDLGELKTARGTEMMLPLWLTLLGKIGHHNFNWHVQIAD